MPLFNLVGWMEPRSAEFELPFAIQHELFNIKEEKKMTEEKKTQENAEATEAKAAVKEEVKPAEKASSEAKEDAKPKVKLSEKMKSMMDTIGEMSVLELSDLVKALEDKFGVSAAAPVAIAASGGAGGAVSGGAEEEKSVFTVILAEIGPKKINVIKEIRALTNLGLKEAKDLVEAAPKEVKDGLTKEEAEKMKKQLEGAGAKVELK